MQISYEKGNLKGTYPNVPEGVLWCLCVCVIVCMFVRYLLKESGTGGIVALCNESA